MSSRLVRNSVVLVVMAVFGLALLWTYIVDSEPADPYTYSELLRDAGTPGKVESVIQDGEKLTVTLNGQAEPRTVIVQGGGYGEHQLVSVTRDGKSTPIGSPLLTVHLEPGCGQTLELTMRRYANAPTARHPWHRTP